METPAFAEGRGNLEPRNLTRTEARYLVDAYYTVQDYRKTAANQLRAATPEHEQPSEVLSGFLAEYERLEHAMQKELERFAKSEPVGRWMMSITGIGPVISAGLLAHIEIEKAQAAGNIWSFAGLNPTATWSKGEKRPWNARLKTLCWLIGESFVKFSNHPKDMYGRVYVERKEYESERNDRGDNGELAAQILAQKRIGKETEAYKSLSQGKLPPGQIHARAKRYAVKRFLSHVFEVMYRDRYGKDPPAPYAIAHLEHVHKMELPVPFEP